jgi:hypothetical protein
MGGKRVSDEERVIAFFQNAPSDAVVSIFKVVQSIVKSRVPKVPKTGTKRKVKQPDSRQASLPAVAPPPTPRPKDQDIPF